jgi:hypothetical protein
VRHFFTRLNKISLDVMMLVGPEQENGALPGQAGFRLTESCRRNPP